MAGRRRTKKIGPSLFIAKNFPAGREGVAAWQIPRPLLGVPQRRGDVGRGGGGGGADWALVSDRTEARRPKKEKGNGGR